MKVEVSLDCMIACYMPTSFIMLVFVSSLNSYIPSMCINLSLSLSLTHTHARALISSFSRIQILEVVCSALKELIVKFIYFFYY
jgi:hypothetical protein